MIRASRLIRRIVQASFLGAFAVLFVVLAWPYGGTLAGHRLSHRLPVPLDAFLSLDPLVGISAAIAAGGWNPALLGAALVLALCIVVPRGFCSYVCPLGTLIDAADWLAARLSRRPRSRRFQAVRDLRWYVLAAVLVAAAGGVMLAGYAAAIPVLTRGAMFTFGWAHLAAAKNPGMVPPLHGAALLSVGLFAAVFMLAAAAPRFWCRYICPSGAVASLLSAVSPSRRRVLGTCTGCGRCVRACPFDAIGDDFANRPLACATCRTCAGVCPADAIRFTARASSAEQQTTAGVPAPAGPAPVSRRGLLAASLAGGAAAMAVRIPGAPAVPLRPPGSVPEPLFLRLCVRCGECFRVCPGQVLQPAGLSAGIDALWTPVVVPSHAGCHQDCNFCTQVCPTHAIRPLGIDEKRRTKIGLAVIDTRICLPHTGQRDCRLCYLECEAAGYHAIEMRTIRLEVGDIPPGAVSPDEAEQMARIEAPHIVADRCTGCGLCEYRCHSALVRRQRILPRSAVVIVPPGGR